jgi:Dynein heavy chain, N-terminal region 1
LQLYYFVTSALLSTLVTFSATRFRSSLKLLIHSIETIVIEWTHQIREVLKKDSAQPLLEGLNPSPYVELDFWDAKARNLGCIVEQVITIINLHCMTFALDNGELLILLSTLTVINIRSGADEKSAEISTCIS